MTTAIRGESAPVARPVDRPFTESQSSPPRPAPQPPTLALCREIDEHAGSAGLPPCLRSRPSESGAQGGDR